MQFLREKTSDVRDRGQKLEGIHQSAWILRFYWNVSWFHFFIPGHLIGDRVVCGQGNPVGEFATPPSFSGLDLATWVVLRWDDHEMQEAAACCLIWAWTSYCRFCISVQWPLTSHSRANVNALLLRSVKKSAGLDNWLVSSESCSKNWLHPCTSLIYLKCWNAPDTRLPRKWKLIIYHTWLLPRCWWRPVST